MSGRALRAILAAGLAASALAPGVAARTLYAANNGIDGAECGAKATPCRSISRALANAVDRDRIIVNPGLYGDLDRDGNLGGVGEETAGAAAVHVTLDVVITSRDGAAVTIIDSGTAAGADVLLAASGVTFGKSRKGFTLAGSNAIGLDTSATATDLRIRGNFAIGHTSYGFRINGDRVEVRENLAIGNDHGFFEATSTARDNRYLKNVAIGNTGFGFRFGGTGHRIQGNAATGNGASGFVAFDSQSLSLLKNVASGNGSAGLAAGSGSTALEFRQNTATGNLTPGIIVLDAASTTEKNNVFGNDPAGGPANGTVNCGIESRAATPVDAGGTYWGDSGGPGPDPADEACGPLDEDRPATRERRIKVPFPKL